MMSELPADVVEISSCFNTDFSSLYYSRSKNKFYQLEDDFFGNHLFREKQFTRETREVVLTNSQGKPIRVTAEQFEHWWREHEEFKSLRDRITELEKRVASLEMFVNSKE